jgi:diguanylate cyclase (GGDEF)-like protein
MDRLSDALAGRKPPAAQVGVMLLDLDRFKVINDSLGHSVGDELLQAVGCRLSNVLRAEDTVARFGGDEFVVLVEAMADRCGVLQLAERIIDAFRQPFMLGSREVFTSVSIGIALGTPHFSTPEEKLRHADVALYRAKARGRAQFGVYDAQMSVQTLERLEITESTMMSASQATSRTLSELKKLGVRLAIDDFGTGYSSLSYLRRFPIDTLKIDQSFVAGLDQQAEDLAIVEAVTRLANALGMDVTAEGIETDTQRRLLEQLHCDRGQGYYFSRPLRRERMDAMLQTRRLLAGSKRSRLSRS